MILLIDIGNTNTVCAVYNNQKYLEIKRVDKKEDIQPILETFLKYNITDIAIASVVPILEDIFTKKINKIFGINPFIVTHNNSNIVFKVDNPNEVGADRICNAKAAIHEVGGNCIIVDFGTATTYDVLNEQQEFIGGAIAPGVDISANYLIKKAALLKETILEFPEQIIAKSTKTNIQSGVMYSAVYAIEGMIRHISAELEQKTTTILTGGFSVLMSPKLSCEHILDFNLTLDGIRIIYEENN